MQNIIIPPYFPTPMLQDEEDDQQKLLRYEDDQQIDALSLRDPPIATAFQPPPSQRNTATTAVVHNNNHHSRIPSTSSSSDPTSDFFFKFLINHDDDLITSTADIFHRRLLPCAPPPLPRRSLSLSSVAARLTRPQLADHESSSSPALSLPNIRPSRSLNYRKLRRNRSNTKPKAADVIQRSSWNNSSDKSQAKLPWYWALVFGLPKLPAEMELKDIKSRQFRRQSTTSPPSSRLISGNRNCSSASWKLLNVLSCKSHAAVDVSNAAPFRNSFEKAG